MDSTKERKILREAQDRLRKCIDEDLDNRKLAKEDLEFVAIEGKQWPDVIKADRLSEGRPCISVNKLPTYIDQVVGDQRMNRPAIKVVPVDSQADIKIAEILSGWIRHVQQISKSDVAIDHAFEHAVACGYGALRVVTKYISDTSFDQEAYIEKIDNALAVFWGRHLEYDASDASYCFIISDLDREEFKVKYNIEPMPFNSSSDTFVDGWVSQDTVRVAEYFVKEPVEKMLYLVSDGRVLEKLEGYEQVVRKRKVKSFKIMWYLLSGDKVIDSKEWLGRKYIPIVPVWGKEFNVAGKRILRGLVRNAKDSQRMYNYWRSVSTETIALQPKAPYILTPKQIQGHEDQWREAHRKNYPYLLANPDKEAPGWPYRQAPPQASSAFVEEIRETDQEIRDTTGLQKAALGMPSNEKSGAAIRERKLEGDTGTFAFIDNLSRSLEHVGRILVDIAPVLLDTERIIRLGLDDGKFEFVGVNVEVPNEGIFNDLSIGTYDIIVITGPSFSTQRSEARQSMQEFIQYYPAAAQVIGDLYAKSMDWSGADEIGRRLEYLLPPEIRAELEAKRAEKEGKSPEQAVPDQAQQSPEELMKVQEAQFQLKEMELKVQQETVKLEGLKVKNEILINSSKENIRRLLKEIEKEDSENSKESEVTTQPVNEAPITSTEEQGTSLPTEQVVDQSSYKPLMYDQPTEVIEGDMYAS